MLYALKSGLTPFPSHAVEGAGGSRVFYRGNWASSTTLRTSVASFLLMAAMMLISTVANADPKFPPLTGRVVDDAHLLTAADKDASESELKALEDKSSDQLVIYTTNSLQGYPIEDFGYRLGRAWGIGQKDKNNGAILIVAPSDRKVRIE